MSADTIRMVKNSQEYKAISRFYGDRTAKRSQVPLMNHINEGLIIMDAVQSSYDAMCAFCLHPLFQNDAELTTQGYHYTLYVQNPRPVMLTMEYRRIANLYLAHCKMPETGIELSVLPEVQKMLIGDKVQNRKDFIKYHFGTHPNSDRLYQYFNEWMQALGINDDEYNRLIRLIENEQSA